MSTAEDIIDSIATIGSLAAAVVPGPEGIILQELVAAAPEIASLLLAKRAGATGDALVAGIETMMKAASDAQIASLVAKSETKE